MEVTRKTGARRDGQGEGGERTGGGRMRDTQAESEGRQRSRKEKKGRQGREREEREGSSRSCGLPVTDSASDNAFIMGKGEQRKGLIHRRVRES